MSNKKYAIRIYQSELQLIVKKLIAPTNEKARKSTVFSSSTAFSSSSAHLVLQEACFALKGIKRLFYAQ